MFEPFKKVFSINSNKEASNTSSLINDLNNDIKSLLCECGGFNFKNGLYKVHTIDSSIHWAILITTYFEKFKNKIIPFGYDWMGRQFAIDLERSNYILMFDPSTGEYFEFEDNLIHFHNHELIVDLESFLSDSTFHDVLKLMKLKKISYNDCLGFSKPLFVGGDDALNNYERIDLEVYWDIQCQLYLQIRNLPPGTKINSIQFKKK